MTNWISNAIAKISSLFQGLQVKRFLAVAVVGLIVLTTNVDSGRSNSQLRQQVRESVEQNDAQRPKTIGQWNREARETKGNPGERLQRIGQQSGEAFKEFGSGYVEGAKETAGGVKDSAAQAGRDISNSVGR
ncbi:hypothetical protein HCG51_20845 [Tolypothrix sp. PCC 7910]|uniref:hypothetical protein n=1 Tax=Tolypothrix sp. PCC 7910 TaxID=2099387 RepID=UPI00142795EF|nr:hypothetical protein [Tolypothrix sp. PCC 7910]QIR38910.1 hypothetical protein HCG51_20845 [Tolypothrix sp. PCC 7910]